jgi:hypothetical protein
MNFDKERENLKSVIDKEHKLLSTKLIEHEVEMEKE